MKHAPQTMAALAHVSKHKMITAILIAGLLFFPSPITRDPSRPQEIALTQWGEAWLGVAHNTMAGGSFYKADTVRVLIDGEWMEYEVVKDGVYLCDTPRPNCNDAVFIEMYEPNAVILATCWPIGGMTRGQWIIKLEQKFGTNGGYNESME